MSIELLHGLGMDFLCFSLNRFNFFIIFFFFFTLFVQVQGGLERVKPGLASQGWQHRVEILLFPVMRAQGATLGFQEEQGQLQLQDDPDRRGWRCPFIPTAPPATSGKGSK